MVRELDPYELPVKMTLREAGVRFIADCESRNLATESIGKCRLMIREMEEKLADHEVKAISVDDLARYREQWKASPITALKKLERLRAFFRFSMDRGWTRFNAAVSLRKPKAKIRPTLPFSDSEVEKILWATEIYPIKGIYREKSRERIRAFVKLLLYSGLRIRDAVTIEFDRFDEDGRIMLYTQKTGQPVFVPVPQDVVTDVISLRREGNRWPFWPGDGNPKSAVGDWQRSLRTLFKLAGVKGHAHMFRDTIAVRLLEKGVPLETVAVILEKIPRDKEARTYAQVSPPPPRIGAAFSSIYILEPLLYTHARAWRKVGQQRSANAIARRKRRSPQRKNRLQITAASRR
jgi:integrase